MLPIFGWLASIVTGPIIKSALDSAVDAYKSKLAIENNRDSKAVELAEKELLAEIEARKQATEILKVEQGRWWTAMVRPLFAVPLLIYWWKVVLYDKVFGWGTTDALGGHVELWATAMVTAFFVTRPFEKVAHRFFKR